FAGERNVARLGLELSTLPTPAQSGARSRSNGSMPRPPRTLLVQTGRIDLRDAHDGVPPEPMMIFMKWLTREWNEQTAWARAHLSGRRIVWQFDTADGSKYATLYHAAYSLGQSGPPHRLQADSIPVPLGILGDGSHEYQVALTERITNWIASHSRAH